jgi:hypothetical protein
VLIARSPGWWIVVFQLVSILYAAYAVRGCARLVCRQRADAACCHLQATVAHGKRSGAARLLAILTASTFLFTCDVANAPLGAYAFSHNASGTPAVVTGKKATLTKNGMFVMFAGLIIVDIGAYASWHIAARLRCANRAIRSAPRQPTPSSPSAWTMLSPSPPRSPPP